MILPRPAQVVAIRNFAGELSRSPLYECGHSDAWVLVSRAETTDDLLFALGYCAGYADCGRLVFVWDSPRWRIADTLATAARTFAAALRADKPTDLERCVATYRSELAELLADTHDGDEGGAS